MSQIKISIPLSPEVHRAAKLEAVRRGSLTSVIEDVIDSHLSGQSLPRASHTVAVRKVRASVMLDQQKLEAVGRMCAERCSLNGQIAQWMTEYFERQVSA